MEAFTTFTTQPKKVKENEEVVVPALISNQNKRKIRKEKEDEEGEVPVAISF